jgi:NAD(P)-dependent dehydrogenase (short-subunit alcohol dehydrogenase family)
VLVTGGVSGLGAALVERFRGRGDQVLVCDIADGADRHLDVRSEDDWTAARDWVAAEWDGVDLLVNNAGRSIRRSIALSYDRMHDFERTMAINYFAPVRLMLGLLPGMVERGDGHVVNVLTWGVQVKAPKFAAYIASKTALDVWSRIAGRELYGDGVTFTNIRLGLVRTAMSGPTDVYRRVPALTPAHAAAKVVRALEDRPRTVNNAAGTVAEVLNLVAPRLSDALFHRMHRRFPDSRAARGR